jgi:hypothetical protein
MTRKISLAAIGIMLAAGLLYFVRNTNRVSSDQKDRLIKRDVPGAPATATAPAPVVETICVAAIQNLSHKPVKMDGVEDELVVQLQKAGFPSSRKISDDNGKACDATVNAELVDLSGRGRKTARVDFRLTLAGEQPPRISAQAVGKSSDNQVAKFASGFAPAEAAPPQASQERAEHEAVVAALEHQAQQIRTAYQRGLPPWLPPTP